MNVERGTYAAASVMVTAIGPATAESPASPTPGLPYEIPRNCLPHSSLPQSHPSQS